MYAVLHVIGGADRGKQYELNRPETRVGRGADQDFVLSDIAVSRRHFTIHNEGGRYRLQDLGSGNGTLVNSQRVGSHYLQQGDHIEVGQTVMRFEQAQAGAQAFPPPGGPPKPFQPTGRPISDGPPMTGSFQPSAPSPMPGFPQPGQAPPQVHSQPTYAPPPAVAPAAPQPTFAPHGPLPTMAPGAPAFAPLPNETPSDAVQMPGQTGTASPYAARPSADQTSFFATPAGRIAVFGAMGLVSVISLFIILARTVFAKPVAAPSEAEALYRQGIKLFANGDFEGAKVSFGEARGQAPDSPEVKRYLELCDLEMKARDAVKAAEQAVAQKSYLSALKKLEEVTGESILDARARRMRQQYAPRAAAEEVEEARRMVTSDPDGARTRLGHAIELDPTNEDARALLGKVKESPTRDDARPEPPEPRVAVTPPKPKPKVEDDDLVPIKVPKTKPEPVEPAPPPGKAVGSLTAAAMGFYRSKDFFGAEKALRQEALKQDAKKSQKTIETANEVRRLKGLLDSGDQKQDGNPEQAIKDFQEALSVDGRLAKGAHASYIRGKLGQAHLSFANKSFNAGKYDVAFTATQAAQKYGAGDGGMGKKLEAKANELIAAGQKVIKTNAPQAKSHWRTVIKMVPAGSPVYLKAYQLLNNAAGSGRDEDED